MTATKPELTQRLMELDARMPALTSDMNAFFREFEDAGGFILADAAPEDQAFVETELLGIVQRAGVTPMDIAPMASRGD